MRISDWSSDVCSSDLVRGGRGRTQRHAAKVRPNGDVALAVVAIDLSRTALHGQGRDAGEGHRALPTVHAHVGDRRQILPGGVGNPCADIDLARVGVEPGDQGIEVTRRGDTDGVADSGRGYADRTSVV